MNVSRPKVFISNAGMLAALLVGVAGLAAGCATTESSQSAAPAVSAEENAKRPPIVIVSVNAIGNGSAVEVNGTRVGITPVDVYIEVDAQNRLQYDVRIEADPGGSETYRLGETLPRKITFVNNTAQEDGVANERAKAGTRPSAGRMN